MSAGVPTNVNFTQSLKRGLSCVLSLSRPAGLRPPPALAFGCAGEDLVGRMLKQVLAECAMDAAVFAGYRTVFLRQLAQVLRVDGKDGVAVHYISPLPCSLTVQVTCVAAIGRVLAAQRAVREVESIGQRRPLDKMRGRPETT